MSRILVREGIRLLAGYDEGAGLTEHRARFGELPDLDRDHLLALARAAALRGRGGAGFPFATKLEAVAGKRRVVLVVNLAEGEPASSKDAVLGLGRPHLVLDGAVLVARALRVREIHLAIGTEAPLVAEAVARAISERPERMRFVIHEADDRFVAGQARAVLELMSGRPNLPVTAWAPEVFDGHRGRPTLLSNAETWAQLAVRALPGSAGLPETTLLTWDGERQPVVIEAREGAAWREVLPPGDEPLVVGGYHGSWVERTTLEALPLLREEMAAAGVPLGAGAAIPLAHGECPVTMTARIIDYLAAQSAGRCGPCRNGLPALARALAGLRDGADEVERLRELAGMVVGRGACAHPDGTVRLVRSLLEVFPDEVDAHRAGRCARISDRAGV